MSAGLQERIESDLRTAMRAGEVVERETLRMALAALRNRRIELGRDLEGPEVLEVLAKAVKTRRESVGEYERGGRPELAERERAEIAVLERYLPEQRTEDDVRVLVAQAIEESGARDRKDVGGVMKLVMSRHRGEVDGKVAQRIATELLSG